MLSSVYQWIMDPSEISSSALVVITIVREWPNLKLIAGPISSTGLEIVSDKFYFRNVKVVLELIQNSYLCK